MKDLKVSMQLQNMYPQDIRKGSDTSQTEISRILILGAGGHGREVALSVVQREIVFGDMMVEGFFADEFDPALLVNINKEYLGRMEDIIPYYFAQKTKYLSDAGIQGVSVFPAIGKSNIRKTLVTQLEKKLNETVAVDIESPNFWCKHIISPDATIGNEVYAAEGFYVAPGSRITTNVIFGKHVHCNVQSTISHDCVIGDFVTISPGAIINGNVTLGNNVFLGSGSIVLPGVCIGDNATIGAGSVVCRDVDEGITVVGVPAKVISSEADTGNR